jgi:small subunit ribosomal protein S20
VAHHKSAKKRIRQNEKRRLRNTARKTRCKNVIKDVLRAVEAGDLEKAEAAFRLAAKTLDRTAAKGTYHRNRVARTKSRLQRRINALRRQRAAA